MEVYLACWRVSVIEVLFVRVHPNLRSTDSVLKEVGSGVWRFLGEHMTHMGAWVNF